MNALEERPWRTKTSSSVIDMAPRRLTLAETSTLFAREA
jgi:hypothetical protein